MQDSKPNNKKRLLWGCFGCLGVIVILGVLLGACTVMIGGSNSNQSSSSTSSKDKNSSEKNQKDEKIFKIGDKVKTDELDYTVKSVNNSKTVGNSFAPHDAKGTYLIVDITVKNNGNDPVTLDSNMFKLKIGDKTLEPDSEGSLSANQGEDGSIKNDFIFEKLNPDSEMTGKIAFDVSEDLINKDNKILQVQNNLLGTSKSEINLN
ncbi:DUF4352 domain-containing protein [Mammaliicoccus sciuri]|uniref:DUF4352 domain-containing protein n=1 Tax=Mammaliicoccus sciuri TaxID=1296 RepID=UPI00397E9142